MSQTDEGKNLENSAVRIACASDRRYALPLAVMLRSLAAHAEPGRHVEVYVLDDGIDPADKDRILESLTGCMTVQFVQPGGSAVGGLPTWGRMSSTTYQKLTIGEWLPETTEKVLWLDCDLLVLSDIARLWESGLGANCALAARDPRVPYVSSHFGVSSYRDLGLAATAKYFNAGVMLIDLTRWRSSNVAARAIDYLKTYPDEVFFWDQEALNVVLAGQWGELDPIWNWHPTIGPLVGAAVLPTNRAATRDSRATPRIVHFSGNLKPWIYRGSNPYYEVYYRYLDQTAWAGWRPQPKWWKTMLGIYETSQMRRLFYPAEQAATHVLRFATRRYDRT